MPRADCEDCAWSDDADDLLEASDLAEEHEAKEHHRVSIERVAADGGMLSDETVYVRGANQGGNTLVLHTDRDCSRLSNARTVFSRSRDTYPDDVPVCEWCSGSVEHAGGENDGPWKDLEAADPDDLATDGGQDYVWIVTCPHDERIVVEDDLEAAVLGGQGVYDVTIASWEDGLEPQPIVADGGHVPEDELADELEAEICSKIWDRDDRRFVFKSARLAEQLDMPVNRFNAGLRKLRKREDARVEIERWNGETCNSPWEATLTKQRVVADGGRDLPSPVGWAFAAVVHGADVDADCLALTNAGDPCTYNAYSKNDLPVCNTHADVDEPDVVEDAHQWARIKDGADYVTVCVNCEEVWKGQEPETAVDCPTCAAEAGQRCKRETAGTGISAPIPPHPERRAAAYGSVPELEPCDANPAVDEDQQLLTDGGTAMLTDHDPCPECERQVTSEWTFCPSCGNGIYDPTLEFAPEYVEPILEGRKDATVRYGTDGFDVDVGDTVALQTESGETIALADARRVAEVIAVEALSVMEVFGASYPTDDVDELIEGVNRHYDAPITPGTAVRVIHWELVQDRKEVADV